VHEEWQRMSRIDRMNETKKIPTPTVHAFGGTWVKQFKTAPQFFLNFSSCRTRRQGGSRL
jgi:hypothetical protein